MFASNNEYLCVEVTHHHTGYVKYNNEHHNDEMFVRTHTLQRRGYFNRPTTVGVGPVEVGRCPPYQRVPPHCSYNVVISYIELFVLY